MTRTKIDELSREFLMKLMLNDMKFIRGFFGTPEKYENENGFHRQMLDMIEDMLDKRIAWWEDFIKGVTETSDDFDEKEELKVI